MGETVLQENKTPHHRIATFGLFRDGKPKISSIVHSNFMGFPEETDEISNGIRDITSEFEPPCIFDPLTEQIPKTSIVVYNTNNPSSLQSKLQPPTKSQGTKKHKKGQDFIRINRQRIKSRLISKYTESSINTNGSDTCERKLVNPQISGISSIISSNGSQNSRSSYSASRTCKLGVITGNRFTSSISATSSGSGSKSKSVYHSPTRSFGNHGEFACGFKTIQPTITRKQATKSRRNRSYLSQQSNENHKETLSKLWYPKQTSSMTMNVSMSSSDNINDLEE